MDQGRILMLFPEGTRVLPMQSKPFKLGGAIVSQRTGYAVLPVAHNAGEFWPRHSWIKWPGTIRVVIGPPIEPEGKKPEAIIAEVGDWITRECDVISDKSSCNESVCCQPRCGIGGDDARSCEMSIMIRSILVSVDPLLVRLLILQLCFYSCLPAMVQLLPKLPVWR